MMLWNYYVFRRGKGVHELWDRMHHKRKLRLLYIAGRGFDVRAQAVMKQYVANLQASGCEVVSAKLVLLAFTGYALEQDVQDLTEENAQVLEQIFSPLGHTAGAHSHRRSNGRCHGRQLAPSHDIPCVADEHSHQAHP